ncbi:MULTISPECIES: methionine/alanine import family NSS transporter small subunit [unclassified Leucobacter]|nr:MULTISPECIES: methionine/alanine import family NSS transporter small subunit [unclassified Leucobacter]
MTPIAIVFLVLATVIIWGGLVGSTIALSRKGEVDAYPAGGEDRAGERLE